MIVTIVDEGGFPISEVDTSADALPGYPAIVAATDGTPVTIIADGGFPVTLINADLTPYEPE